VPFSPPLEKFVTPDAAKIEAAVRRTLAERRPQSQQSRQLSWPR
jgi:hypothetical protein